MNILICSDGTPASDGAAHLGGMLARATKAPVTLLGIVENPADDQPLRQALDRETDILRRTGVPYQTVVQSGEPTAQILGETSAKKYDLIVIGSRRRNVSGGFWQSQRTYEIIKARCATCRGDIASCHGRASGHVCTSYRIGGRRGRFALLWFRTRS